MTTLGRVASTVAILLLLALPALAVLGGGLIAMLGDESGWRWSFLVNVPIAVLAVLAAKFLLPDAAWRTAAGTGHAPSGGAAGGAEDEGAGGVRGGVWAAAGTARHRAESEAPASSRRK